jgi:hypothetical protein
LMCATKTVVLMCATKTVVLMCATNCLKCSLQFVKLATGDNETQKRELAPVLPVSSMKAHKRNRGRAPMEGTG